MTLPFVHEVIRLLEVYVAIKMNKPFKFKFKENFFVMHAQLYTHAAFPKQNQNAMFMNKIAKN